MDLRFIFSVNLHFNVLRDIIYDMRKTHQQIRDELEPRNIAIANEYASGTQTCTTIAKKYGMTTKTVQRIAKLHNVIRTLGDSNRLMASVKKYSDLKVPSYILELRSHLTQKDRLYILQSRPNCYKCNITKGNGTRMEVTFKDNNPHNKRMENLVTICRRCLAKTK